MIWPVASISERVDAMPVTDDYWEHEFYKESFERRNGLLPPAGKSSNAFAARWCAKEALVKCDATFKGQPFSSLEVVRNEAGEVSLAQHANGASTKPSLAVSHFAHGDDGSGCSREETKVKRPDG